MTTHHARELIRNAISTLCREAGAPVTRRPVIRSEPDGPTMLEPEALAALAAAAALAASAVAAVKDHARTAREDGAPWSRIGEAMGYADEPQPGLTSVAEHAFAAVAADLGSCRVFGWTCPACLGVVTDYGPEAGHPQDAEHGHAETCARMTAMVRAWDNEA